MALRFVKPVVSRVRNIIKNPAYAGMYVYGRKQWRAVRAGAEPPPPHRLFGQHVAHEAHHEPYITVEEFEAFEQLLALNRHAPSHSLLGPGPALVQGLVRHAAHGAMSVAYSTTSKGTRWSYRCLGDYLAGGTQCISVPGGALDGAVAEALLHRLDGTFVDEVRRHWLEQQRGRERQRRQADAVIAAKEQERGRFRRKLLDGDDMLPRVRAMFEQEFDRVSGELERLREQPQTTAPEADPFSRRRWDRLRALCDRAATIWQAPTTADHDRKQLARTLITAVVVDVANEYEIRFTVRWTDDAAPVDVVIRRSGFFHRVIVEQWQAGRSIDEIVQVLADMGAKTQQGNAWSPETVRRTINYRLQNSRSGESDSQRDHVARDGDLRGEQ